MKKDTLIILASGVVLISVILTVFVSKNRKSTTSSLNAPSSNHQIDNDQQTDDGKPDFGMDEDEAYQGQNYPPIHGVADFRIYAVRHQLFDSRLPEAHAPVSGERQFRRPPHREARNVDDCANDFQKIPVKKSCPKIH